MRHRAPFNERPAVVSRNRQVLPHWCNSGEATMSLNDTTPTPRGATAGIDWASDNHAVCVLDPDGAVIERQTVAHTAAGLRRLIDLLSRHRVQAVGIERGDGPVIDALLATDLTIYVIPPSQVKNLRGRYGSAGNKDDRFDAYVLADTIRTDRHRLTPLVLDQGHEVRVGGSASRHSSRDHVSGWACLGQEAAAGPLRHLHAEAVEGRFAGDAEGAGDVAGWPRVARC